MGWGRAADGMRASGGWDEEDMVRRLGIGHGREQRPLALQLRGVMQRDSALRRD